MKNMKNKFLLLFGLLILVGCGSTTPSNSDNDLNNSSSSVEQISDSNSELSSESDVVSSPSESSSSVEESVSESDNESVSITNTHIGLPPIV